MSDNESNSIGCDDSDCEHYFDGGECIECGKKSLCELCDINEWDTRCETCDKGRICYECMETCSVCNNSVCSACIEYHSLVMSSDDKIVCPECLMDD